MNIPLHNLSFVGMGLLFLLLGAGAAGQAHYAMQSGATAQEAGWLKTSSGRVSRSTGRVRGPSTPMSYGNQRTAGFTGMGFGMLCLGAGFVLSYARESGEDDQI